MKVGSAKHSCDLWKLYDCSDGQLDIYRKFIKKNEQIILGAWVQVPTLNLWVGLGG